jgi:L-rhamnose-H+ transport protein
METLIGVLAVAIGGTIMGSGAWPFKLMTKYKFEHWWFVGMLMGLVVLPWTVTLAGCPGALEGLGKALAEDPAAIAKANLFAFGWGIANVLCGLCFVRIGMALTGAILAGLGVSVGVTVPMVFKGSGLFADAPGLGSPAGRAVLAGVAVMLAGVVVASVAGFARDRALGKSSSTSGGFLGGLIMTIVAGVLSSGTALTFIYGQDAIVSRLSVVEPGSTIDVVVDGSKELSKGYPVAAAGTIDLAASGQVPVGGLRANEAAAAIGARLSGGSPGPAGSPKVRVSTGSIPASFGVWAVGLAAGAVVNLGYAAWLMTRNRSWGVLLASLKELILSVIIGVNFSVAVALMGKGMLLLGALGGSVGFGIQQAFQMTGSQGVGFLSGEWRGATGRPRRLMAAAIAILLVAAGIMAYGNTLAKV